MTEEETLYYCASCRENTRHYTVGEISRCGMCNLRHEGQKQPRYTFSVAIRQCHDEGVSDVLWHAVVDGVDDLSPRKMLAQALAAAAREEVYGHKPKALEILAGAEARDDKVYSSGKSVKGLRKALERLSQTLPVLSLHHNAETVPDLGRARPHVVRVRNYSTYKSWSNWQEVTDGTKAPGDKKAVVL